MRVKPHLTGAPKDARSGGQTPSSEGDRLPLRKMEGRSAWDGAVTGSEWEVPPQNLAFGLCPIAGQARSSGSSAPQGSASAPRGQPPGTTGRGEPQPAGSPRTEAREREPGGEDQIISGRRPHIPRAAVRVSKAEREMHGITHTPYRAWCPHCVRARGRNTPHRTREGQREGRGVPKISMDFFLSLIHI